MGEEPLETGGSELVRYWRILTAAFLVALFSGGMRFTIGPFVAPIVADFGITHSQLSAIVAAAMLVFGFSLPVLGRLVDAWGSRIVLLVGTVLVCASLLAMAWTRSPVVFALAFVVTSSLGFAATGPVTLSPLISRWFHRQRGLAMVFLSAGGMGGMALLTPVSAALIQAYGWRYTYMVFAAFTAAVLLPAILVWMKERKARDARLEAGMEVRWRPALSTRPFWFLAVGLFSCGFSMNLLGTHGVPMLEHHGFPTLTASFAVGLIGLVSIAGALLVGWASDRLGRPLFLGSLYLVRGLAFLALIAVDQEWQLYVASLIGGLAWAGGPALTSAITADLYGVQVVGTLYGLLYMGHQIGAAVGSYLGGWAYDVRGDYALAFVVSALLLFIGSMASWRVPSQRAGQMPAHSTTTAA